MLTALQLPSSNPSEVAQNNGLIDSSSSANFVASCATLHLNGNAHVPEDSRQEFRDPFDSKHLKFAEVSERQSPFTSASETLDKDCVYQEYPEQIENSKLISLTKEHVVPKSEQNKCEMEQNQRLKMDDIQDQPNEESQLFCPRQPLEFRDDADIHLKKVDYQQHPFAPCALNRFRIYDPCKENFTSIGSCATCHCSVAPKSSLEMHENAGTPIYHTAVGGRSNASGTSSQNSQNADELPAIKMRMQHVNIPPGEVNHMDIEPKIDYDSAINAAGANTDVEDSSPPPMTVHTKSNVYVDEEQQQQHQQELHLERLHHEYALQQHQQQQHFEALMQENTTGNSFRQRKERMSKKQKEIYVNFMEQNSVINEHRRSDPILDQYWVKLADILNSVPQGAVKHVAEWKQTFDNWRYRVFLYARYNSKISGADALNPKSFKPLTQTDKRAYHFWIRNPDTAPPDLEKMRNVFVNLEETQQE